MKSSLNFKYHKYICKKNIPSFPWGNIEDETWIFTLECISDLYIKSENIKIQNKYSVLTCLMAEDLSVNKVEECVLQVHIKESF